MDILCSNVRISQTAKESSLSLLMSTTSSRSASVSMLQLVSPNFVAPFGKFSTLILDQQKIEREVVLNMKHGVEAKNYEDLAKAEKLKPLEVELRRLEDLSDSIVNDFAYMRQREEEMRSTNGKTSRTR